MEAQTINDWLNLAPADSSNSLLSLINRVKQLGAAPLVMTVAPIMGNQVNQDGFDYAIYQQAARYAARLSGVTLIDANRVMNDRLAGLAPDAQFQLLFRDNWHVNDEGNRLYAAEILQTMKLC